MDIGSTGKHYDLLPSDLFYLSEMWYPTSSSNQYTQSLQVTTFRRDAPITVQQRQGDSPILMRPEKQQVAPSIFVDTRM